jgi:hypothetical protein
MQKKFLIPLFITLIFNTLVAVLLFLLLKGVDFSSLLFISQSIGIKECKIILPISFEYCSNDIKKLAPKTLSPILCEINNKELKATPLSNKNNNQKYTCVYSKGREYLITTGIKTLITQLETNKCSH